MSTLQEFMRSLPSIEKLRAAVGDVMFQGQPLPDRIVVEAARGVLEEVRGELKSGQWSPELEDGKLPLSILVDRVKQSALAWVHPSLVRVLNGTGVVIHTNLGRSPLGNAALQHMSELSKGYCNLEFDLQTGERGSRFVHAERLMALLTGAEACVVVNNNAAAVLLVLTAMARGKEVVVSRSELIEIGGSFRLPDIMAVGGARLREVGTTNKTHLHDYERAIGAQTGLVMRAHRSNYSVEGFVHDVPRVELVALCRQHGVASYEDLGSGLMFEGWNVSGGEQDVAGCVKEGMDLVSFSGDKLLGGPQAGIVVGSKALIQRLKKHPLTRALRPDKLTLAALEAVCLSYLTGRFPQEIPVWQMLNATPALLEERARVLARQLNAIPGVMAEATPMVSKVGGGALPSAELPSFGVLIQKQGFSEEALSLALRSVEPAVVGRMEKGRFAVDLRTLSDMDVAELCQHLMDLEPR